MGHSEFDPAAQERRPWNAGRMVGAKRALKPQDSVRHVWMPPAGHVWMPPAGHVWMPPAGHVWMPPAGQGG